MVMQKHKGYTQFQPVPGLVRKTESTQLAEPGSEQAQPQGQVSGALTASSPQLFSEEQWKGASAILQAPILKDDPVTPHPPFLESATGAQPMLPRSQSTQGFQRFQSLPGSIDLPGRVNVPVVAPVTNLKSYAKPAATTRIVRRTNTAQRQRRQSVLVGGITCVMIVLGALSFSIWNMINSATPRVTLYQVGSQSALQPIGGSGTVFPLRHFDLSYPMNERVVALLVKAGDRVSRNQPLIQLDPSELNSQVQQASEDLNTARANLAEVSINGSYDMIAQAQQAYDLQKRKYAALVADASSSTLRNGMLIAPMSGVVSSLTVNAGEGFSANTTLLTLVDESRVTVHVQVPLANLGRVKSGQSASVTPVDLPDHTLSGSVNAIIPQADPQTDTYEVWIEVENKEHLLLPGMRVFVHIQSQERAYKLPRLAVLGTDRAGLVFVVQNQRVVLRPVHVVGRGINTFFVDAGLTPGERVVLVGLAQLHDGQFVQVAQIESQA